MCGRIDFHDPKPFLEDLQKYYDWDISDYIRYETAATGYNIPPSSDILTWHEHHHNPQIEPMHWGLIPFWAKDSAIGNRMINAKSEPLTQKPAFRTAFRHRRCLIPVNGFYEWQKFPSSKQKQPYYIKAKENPYLLLAGLWEEWGEEKIKSCTIITADANEALELIHNRMPVIIPPEEARLWLDDEITQTDILTPLLKPIAPEVLEVYPVSEYVNSPVHNDRNCITKI